jgi:hypothetical protein
VAGGINHYQKKIQMPIRVEVDERNRVRLAGNGQKGSRPKRAATSIQKYADIVQGRIGDNYVGLTVAIDISDGSLMVLAMAERTATEQKNDTERRINTGTHAAPTLVALHGKTAERFVQQTALATFPQNPRRSTFILKKGNTIMKVSA